MVQLSKKRVRKFTPKSLMGLAYGVNLINPFRSKLNLTFCKLDPFVTVNIMLHTAEMVQLAKRVSKLTQKTEIGLAPGTIS